ncbi:hypothetical protein [Natronoglycomyces albus]|uniref:Uncharacterized protein n=1 Tax=Natronoglycomyces albus TaxID=2811108 RepID=A0A895XPN4_9ACTN|nr:hypothetical protein [Natronoglycomyces albus]QSB07127.1 hypothetical protein JQS30_16835 [Natronoglycomyces albus]
MIDMNDHRPTPQRVEFTPIQKEKTVTAGRTMLATTPLGRTFLALAEEFDSFIPARSIEAASTWHMLTESARGMRAISAGIEECADVIAACGLHQRVCNRLYGAVESSAAMSSALVKAQRKLEDLYEGQLEQEASAATTIQPVPVDIAGDEAAGIGPLTLALAVNFESFEPTLEAEASSILELIKTSQAGFALMGEAMEGLGVRMARHSIDQRVRQLVRSSSDHGVSTAMSFQAARRAMTELYHGQVSQENSGTTTIRTLPFRRVG